MENIFVFKTEFIEKWKQDVRKNKGLETYFGEKFPFGVDDIFQHHDLKIEKLPDLLFPEKNDNHSVENAISLFEAFKTLTETQASDVRFWTYLSHVTYWDFMRKRYSIASQPKEKQGAYILSHWHINSLNTANLTRFHGIASLWWGAYRTYDESKKDPYELTRELFSMLDYSTHLMSGTQGRNQNFFHAVLEFVVQNKELFSVYKQSRVRYMMRVINRIGGYKIFAGLSKEAILEELAGLKNDIEKINDQFDN